MREIHEVHAIGADDVVFQIEVPAELVAVARVPAPLQPAVARRMAAGIATIARGGAGRHPVRRPPVPRGHEPQGARA